MGDGGGRWEAIGRIGVVAMLRGMREAARRMKEMRGLRGGGQVKRSRNDPYASSRRPAEKLLARRDALSLLSGNNQLIPCRTRQESLSLREKKQDSLSLRDKKIDSLLPFHHASSALSMIRGGTDALCVMKRQEALSILRRRRDAVSTIARRKDALSLIRRRQNELKLVDSKRNAICPIKCEGRRKFSVLATPFVLNSRVWFDVEAARKESQLSSKIMFITNELRRKVTHTADWDIL